MLILAVDDDRDDLDLFCEAVREIDSSIDLITAYTGEEALDLLLKKVITLPDFIFLDINMPRLDGRECLKAIRKNKSTKNASVIMYSTALSSADKGLFEELGAKFLTKACSYTELQSSLKMIIGQLQIESTLPISLLSVINDDLGNIYTTQQ